MDRDLNTTIVAGLPIVTASRQEFVKFIEDVCTGTNKPSSPFIVFEANGHGISMSILDKNFLFLLSQASAIVADGQSVVIGSKLFSPSTISERMAITDLITDIPTLSDKPLKHFLLGGADRIAADCGDILQKRHANFLLSGTHKGHFTAADSKRIISYINDNNPDVLWVGLGKPTEQQWVIENRHEIHAKVIITCGGCFNYVTGAYGRAPKWMQSLGLEWLFRLAEDPKKLFWRYMTTNPLALYAMIFFRRSRF
jgi:exopolysaccharide biosynthesis WecB/TagA/CpsF family protein